MNKGSIFKTMPLDEFKTIVANSKTVKDVYNKLGISSSGSSYRIFRRMVVERGIDTSHFNQLTKDWKSGGEKLTNEMLFIDGGNNAPSSVKKRILRDNLIPYQCCECKNEGSWQGKPLALQMDHIDGRNTNNTLANLRFLCPNCHYQTKTWGGRKLKKERVQKFCEGCGVPCTKESKHCRTCSPKYKQPAAIRKNGKKPVAWPTKEEMAVKVWKSSLLDIARELDCTDNTVKEFCKRERIEMPPKRYHSRIKNGYSHEEAISGIIKNTPKTKKRDERMTDEIFIRALKLHNDGACWEKVAQILGFCASTLLTYKNRKALESQVK